MDSLFVNSSNILISLSFFILSFFTCILLYYQDDAPLIKRTFWWILLIYTVIRGVYFICLNYIEKLDVSAHIMNSIVYIVDTISNLLILIIFILFLFFLINIFHIMFRPNINELGDKSGSKLIKSPSIYKYYKTIVVFLIVSFGILTILHFYFDDIKLQLCSKLLSCIVSICIAIGFIIYGSLLFDALEPLLLPSTNNKITNRRASNTSKSTTVININVPINKTIKPIIKKDVSHSYIEPGYIKKNRNTTFYKPDFFSAPKEHLYKNINQMATPLLNNSHDGYATSNEIVASPPTDYLVSATNNDNNTSREPTVSVSSTSSAINDMSNASNSTIGSPAASFNSPNLSPVRTVAKSQVLNSLNNLLKVATASILFLIIRAGVFIFNCYYLMLMVNDPADDATKFPEWWYILTTTYYILVEVLGMGFILFVLRHSTHKIISDESNPHSVNEKL